MDVKNLVFFKSDGHQVPTQFTNKITFEVIGKQTSKGNRGYGWKTDAKGYVSLGENNQVLSLTLTDKGSSFATEDNIDYRDVFKRLIAEIVIDVKSDNFNGSYKYTDNINDYFDIVIGRRNISVRSEVDAENNFIYEYFVESVSFKDSVDKNSLIKTMFFNEGEEIILYPSQQFMNQILMETVSTELASTDTIFVLEKRKNSKGIEGYYRPRSNSQNLRLEFNEESDTRFVKTAEEYYTQDELVLEVNRNEYDYSKVYWSNYNYFDLMTEYDETEDSIEPLVFTVGFISKEEGCFQDIMTVMTVDYMTENDSEKDFAYNRIGYMVFKNESIGEDERYRTLFANFGIPDPKEYPNLFREQDVFEEGSDWKFLNKKSKELFLSYPEIFPYLGTYKALMNAVNFLGFDDIYFKEWYKYFDGTSENSVAYQSIDIENKSTLQSKLSRIGVSFEEFLDWKKLSQLSLVYSLNKQDESYEKIEFKSGSRKITKTFQIPTTENVYTYLNSEVLVKLYALKEWLETYILNINCQIIDVTGEGVYFERYKQQAYVAPLQTNFTLIKESQISPNFTVKGNEAKSIENGSVSIGLGIGELQESRKFSDLKDSKVVDMISKKMNLGENNTEPKVILYGADGETEETEDVGGISKERLDYLINWYQDTSSMSDDEIINLASQMLVGANASNQTPFEGMQFELKNIPYSGSVKNRVGYFDSSDNFVSCPMVVKENEIFIYGYKRKEIEFQIPPVIRINAGKLRKPFGRWGENIAYNVMGFFDTDATRTRFCIQRKDKTSQDISDDYITLYPSDNAKFKYTANNKYHVPLFIIEGYDTFSRYIEKDSSSNRFVLEMQEGYIDFQEEEENGNTCLARLHFEQDYNRNNANEQEIKLEYIYQTPRRSLMTSEGESIKSEVKRYSQEFLEESNLIRNQINDVSVLDFGHSEYDKSSDNLLLSNINLKRIKEDCTKTEKVIDEKIDVLKKKIEGVESLIVTGDESYSKIYEKRLKDLNESKSKMESLKADIHNGFVEEFENLKDFCFSILSFRKQNAVKNLVTDIQNSNNYNFKKKYNSLIELKHIGEYSLTTKATDAFNIPYAKSSDKKLKVCLTPPTVFVNTYNEEDADFSLNIEKCDTRPWFIPEYFRILKSVDKNDESLIYSDFSYYNDTPKKGNIIHMTNTTERVDELDLEFDASEIHEIGFDFDKSRKYIKIVMNDENPRNQNIFYIGNEVYLSFIDRNSCDLVDKTSQDNESRFSGPYRVDYFINPNINEEDKREENDNFLILSYDAKDLNFIYASETNVELVRTGDLECYANSNMRIDIDKDNIKNDRKTKTCQISFDDKINKNNMAFEVGQCIKISYSSLTYMGQTTSSRGEMVDRIVENYISSTAYKIIEAHYDYDKFKQVYTLDGLINTDLIEMGIYKNGVYNHYSDKNYENIIGVPFKIRCTISPSHNIFTKYDVMATQDADEDSFEGYLKFDDDWFGRDYLDKTFAFTTRKFKTEDAFKDWKNDFKKEEILYAHSNPQILYRTKDVKINVMLSSFDFSNSFENGEYFCIWDVFLNEGHDKSEEQLLYQIVNDTPTLCLTRDGEYHFRLTAIDKNGNCVVNDSQGFLKVISK